MDYFAKTNFSGGIEVLVVQIQDQIRDEFGMGNEHGHHPNFFRVYTLNGEIVSFICLLANNFNLILRNPSNEALIKSDFRNDEPQKLLRV